MSMLNVFEALARAKADAMAGISIVELVGDDRSGYYATRLAPGTKINPHYHRRGHEVYLILEGKGLIHTWLPGEDARVSLRVERGSIFDIPPGVIHQLENDSSDALVLVFSCESDHLGHDRVLA